MTTAGFVLSGIRSSIAPYLVAGVTVLVVASIAFYRSHTPPTAPAFGGIAEPASPMFGGIEVIDGDTVRRGGRVYRLVGFDTPGSAAPLCADSPSCLVAAAMS